MDFLFYSFLSCIRIVLDKDKLANHSSLNGYLYVSKTKVVKIAFSCDHVQKGLLEEYENQQSHPIP